MRVAIYQPRYFPQLHYFNRMLTSDIFVILESAQYTKKLDHPKANQKKYKSYQSHSPIKLPQGEYLLSIPVKHGGRLPINQINIEYNQNWVADHLKTIKFAYSKSQNFNRIFPQIKTILSQKYKNLAQVNVTTIIWALYYLLGVEFDLNNLTLANLNKKLTQSNFRLKRVISDRAVGVARPEGSKKGTEWTIAISTELGATEYYHGATAKTGYMNEQAYDQAGIKLIMQDWKCDQYPQLFNSKVGFIPNLSIIDLVMNQPIEKACEILSK